MPCLWPGRKLGKLRNLGIHGSFFPRFLNLTLHPPYRQNRKLGNKKTRNNYFIKKETPTKVFPVNFVKFSRTPFLQNTSRRILLFLIYLTVSFCKEVLYICSNLLLLEKATKTHNFVIFSFCEYILYSIL